MRPIKLTMNAFLAYKDTQIIDFAEFKKNSMFVVSGPTGSGKTAIFDALSFAIFGDSSTNLRDSETLKSHHAPVDELCFVELIFESGGQTYRIKRQPKQLKISRTGAERFINSTAELELPGGEIIAGVSGVDSKIEEILRMNQSQFKQIVMLPQGDFKRFLEAGSDEKQVIFRKIFETANIDVFTKKLTELKKEAEEKLSQFKMKFETIKESSEDIDTAEMATIEELLGALKESVNEKARKGKELNGEISSLMGEKQKLNIAQAELNNKKLKRLKELRDKFTEFEKDLPHHLQRKKRLENSVSANEILFKRKEINALREQAETAASNKMKVESDGKLASEKLSKYKIKQELLEKSLSIANEIEILDSVLALYLKFLTESERLEELKSKYQSLFIAYTDSQAANLAEGLLENTPCPVCGSKTHPKKAVFSGERVDENALNAAQDAYNKALSIVSSLKSEMLTKLSSFFEAGEFAEAIKKSKELKHEKNNELIDVFAQAHIEGETSIANINSELNDVKKIVDETAQVVDDLRQKYALESSIILKNTKLSEEKEVELKDIISKSFKSEKEALEFSIPSEEFKVLNDKISDFESGYISIKNEVAILSKETSELKLVDIDALKTKDEEMQKQLDVLQAELTSLSASYKINAKNFEEAQLLSKNFLNEEKKYATIASVEKIASGNNEKKISFERYILAYFYEQVIDAANLRLDKMCDSRFYLRRKDEKEKHGKASGLELEIFDNHTGKSRAVTTLSGGESFKVSLSMALGLADIVQQNSGGINIDTMFIDEGFGTLDSKSLDSALEVLKKLRESGRLIGIISHIAEIKETIGACIEVIPDKQGSTIKVIS